MSLIVNSNSQPFEQPEIGMHDAICSFVEDIGTHVKSFSGGPEKKVKMVMLCFELDQKISEGEYAGKPFMRSMRLTFSLHEKSTLSKTLESWLGKKIPDDIRIKGFDLHTLIGRRCTLNLIESNGYVNIANVLPPNAKTNNVAKVAVEVPKNVLKARAESIEAKELAGDTIQESQPATNPNVNDDELPF